MEATCLTENDDLERKLQEILAALPPEARLPRLEIIATVGLRGLGALARDGAADPQRIAEALDRIDFVLGEAVLGLHGK